MKITSKEIANLLIDLECVQLCPHEPFTYASGLKGPIYCDNRKVLSDVQARKLIRDAFAQRVREKSLSFDSVAGMATAGIAHAAFLADALDAPMIYIRSKPKGHGKQNQVEGKYNEGDKALLVEDLVNQGKSLGEGVDGARNAGLKIETALSIVDYEMENAQKLLSEKNVELIALTTFSDLVNAGREKGMLNEQAVQLLESWQAGPAHWQA